nr:hypothetical protein [uncultured Roseateles sp.]
MNAPASGPLDASIVARAWAHGWAISRSTAAPIERAGFFQIHVGKPDQVTRYVFPRLGAHQGVLVATENGAALYQALGWSMVSPVTAASCSAAAPAA